MRGLIRMAGQTELSVGQQLRNRLGIMTGVAGDVRILGLVVSVRQLRCAVTLAARSAGGMMGIVASNAGVGLFADRPFRVRPMTLATFELGMHGMIEARRALPRRAIPDRYGDSDFTRCVDFNGGMTFRASLAVGDNAVMARIATGRNSE